jgi:hypothetical protein
VAKIIFWCGFWVGTTCTGELLAGLNNLDAPTATTSRSLKSTHCDGRGISLCRYWRSVGREEVVKMAYNPYGGRQSLVVEASLYFGLRWHRTASPYGRPPGFGAFPGQSGTPSGMGPPPGMGKTPISVRLSSLLNATRSSTRHVSARYGSSSRRTASQQYTG